jgi:hypothetical protein
LTEAVALAPPPALMPLELLCAGAGPCAGEDHGIDHHKN